MIIRSMSRAETQEPLSLTLGPLRPEDICLCDHYDFTHTEAKPQARRLLSLIPPLLRDLWWYARLWTWEPLKIFLWSYAHDLDLRPCDSYEHMPIERTEQSIGTHENWGFVKMGFRPLWWLRSYEHMLIQWPLYRNPGEHMKIDLCPSEKYADTNNLMLWSIRWYAKDWIGRSGSLRKISATTTLEEKPYDDTLIAKICQRARQMIIKLHKITLCHYEINSEHIIRRELKLISLATSDWQCIRGGLWLVQGPLTGQVPLTKMPRVRILLVL